MDNETKFVDLINQLNLTEDCKNFLTNPESTQDEQQVTQYLTEFVNTLKNLNFERFTNEVLNVLPENLERYKLQILILDLSLYLSLSSSNSKDIQNILASLQPQDILEICQQLNLQDIDQFRLAKALAEFFYILIPDEDIDLDRNLLKSTFEGKIKNDFNGDISQESCKDNLLKYARKYASINDHLYVNQFASAHKTDTLVTNKNDNTIESLTPRSIKNIIQENTILKQTINRYREELKEIENSNKSISEELTPLQNLDFYKLYSNELYSNEELKEIENSNKSISEELTPLQNLDFYKLYSNDVITKNTNLKDVPDASSKLKKWKDNSESRKQEIKEKSNVKRPPSSENKQSQKQTLVSKEKNKFSTLLNPTIQKINYWESSQEQKMSSASSLSKEELDSALNLYWDSLEKPEDESEPSVINILIENYLTLLDQVNFLKDQLSDAEYIYNHNSEQIINLAKEIKDNQSLSSEQQQQLVKLREENLTLNKNLENLQPKFDDANLRNSKLNSTIDTLRAQLLLKEQIIDNLDSDLSNLYTEIYNQFQTYSTLEGPQTTLSFSLKQLTDTNINTNLKNLRNILLEIIPLLIVRINSLETQVGELQDVSAKNQILTKSIEELKIQLKSLMAIESKLTSDNETLRELNTNLTTLNNEQLNIINDNTLTISQLRERLTEVEEDKIALGDSLTAASNINKAQSTQLKAYELDFQIQNKQIASLNDELNSYKNINDNLRTNLENAHVELNNQTKKLTESQNTLSEQSIMHTEELLSNKSAYQENIKEKDNQIIKLNSIIVEQNVKIEEKLVNIVNLNKVINHQKTDILTLKKEYNLQSANLTQVKTDLETVTNQNSSLSISLNSTQETLKNVENVLSSSLANNNVLKVENENLKKELLNVRVELKDTIETNKKAVSNLESIINTQKEEISTLTANIDKQRAHIAKLEQNLQLQSEQINNLTLENNDLSGVKSLNKTLSATLQELRNKNASLSSYINEQHLTSNVQIEQIEKLNSKIASNNSTIQILNQYLEQRNTYILQLEQLSLEYLNLEIEYKKNFTHLNTTIVNNNNKINSLSSYVNELEETIKETNTILEPFLMRMNELESKLTETSTSKQSEIQNLINQIDTLNSSIQEKEGQTNILSETLNTILSNLKSNTNITKKDLEDIPKAIQEVLNTTKKEKATLEDQIKKLKKEKNSTERFHKNKLLNQENLFNKIKNTLNKEMIVMQDRISGLSINLKQEKIASKSFQTKIKSLSTENKTLVEQNKIKNAHIDTILKEVDKLRTTNDLSSSTITDLQSAIKKLNENLLVLSEKFETQETQLTREQLKNEQLGSKNLEVSDNILAKLDVIRQLQKELVSAETSLSGFSDQIQRLTNQINQNQASQEGQIETYSATIKEMQDQFNHELSRVKLEYAENLHKLNHQHDSAINKLRETNSETIEQLTNQLKMFENSNVLSLKQLVSANKQNKDLSNLNDSLQKKLNDASKISQSQSEEIKYLQNKIKTLENNNDTDDTSSFTNSNSSFFRSESNNSSKNSILTISSVDPNAELQKQNSAVKLFTYVKKGRTTTNIPYPCPNNPQKPIEIKSTITQLTYEVAINKSSDIEISLAQPKEEINDTDLNYKGRLAFTVIEMMQNILSNSNYIHINTEDSFVRNVAEDYLNKLQEQGIKVESNITPKTNENVLEVIPKENQNALFNENNLWLQARQSEKTINEQNSSGPTFFKSQ